MKRILSFILVAILCLGVLTGCEQVGGIWDNVSGTVGGWLGLGGNETVAPTVDNAMTVLHNIMKEKNPITRDDYDVVAQVVAASDDGTKGTFKVTWTVDDDAIVIRESTKTGFYTVDLPDANAEEFSYTLTATISDDAGNKASKSYTFTFPVINNTGITSTPEEGVAYKIFLLQGSFQQRYYALATTQNNENKFINTDLDPAKAADFFVEKVDGGYKFYTEVDGVKTYVYAKTTKDESTNKISKYIGFSTEEGSVFSYNEAKGGVWTVKINDLVYGVGTYGTYTTISLSDESYFTPEKVGDSQFVIKFITSEYANTLEPDKAPENEDDAKAILEKLYGLADGESASGSFTLTGKITALDSYNNPTIVVDGYENMPVYCYRLADDRFEIGATITVTALSMKNYGGTYEFMSCTLDKFTAAGGSGSTEGGESYGVVTEIKNGDHVLIGNPANGKLLSANKTGYYNIGVDYTADNFANVTDAEIWVVTVNDDGSYSFTSLTGEKLGMAADYSSFNSEGPNFGWALEAKEGANGIFYIKNTVRGNYIEWYADKGNWSSYATSSLSDLFELAFYVKGATGNVGGGDPVTPPAGNEDAKAILDALYALQDNESLTGPFTLTGKITALDSYKNPTIVVEGYENMPVYCYKLVVDNAVGDVITVTAKSMKNYKGTYEFMDCTLVENGNHGGTDDPVTPPAGTDDPKTILDALYGLAAGESLEGSFTLTGTITKLNYQKYPTIVVEGYEDMPVYCYKLVVTGEVGDVITVTATTLTNYNGTYEFMNCTLVHDCVYAEATCTVVELCTICGAEKPGSTTLPHTWIDATCTVPKTCSVCGGVEGDTIAHTFVNGVCSCGVSESDKKASVNIGDYAAANGWEDGVMQNTITANGDITITATSTNPNVYNGNNTGKFYVSDMTWRIYQADAPQVTISGIEGVTIKYIQIAYVAKNEGTLAIGETFVEDYALVAVNANSVTLTVINNGGGNYTNGQALITGIVVYYEGGNEEAPVQPETPVEPDDGTMTIPEVLASEDGTEVLVAGYVKSIDSAWDSYWGNMNVTIRDEDGNTLYLYRLATEVKLGDYIVVDGAVGSYNGAKQIAQGATAVIVVSHDECTEFTVANCVAASCCVVCGVVNSPALGHSYENGSCTVCGEAEPTAPVVKYYLQATIDGTVYYWNGAAASGKGTLTTDKSAAVELYMDTVDGGVNVYFVDASGAKNYLYFTDGNTGFKLSTSAEVIKYDATNGYLYQDSFTTARYVATYGTQDIRTYKASNIPGSSNNAYMVMTVVE